MCWRRSRHPLFVALVLAGLSACGGAMGERATSAAPTPVAIPPLAPTAPPPAAPAPIVAAPPPGYFEVTVLDVTPTLGGASVEIGDVHEKRSVKMFIGGTEGHSITYRMEHREPERPLTHDLVDAILGKLDAEIVQVQIDDLRRGVFIGTLVLKQGDRLIHIDARPSDAIALALGTKAPIYLAEKVLAKTAAATDDVMDPSPAPKTRTRRR